jgi:site-specific recombinase XerD
MVDMSRAVNRSVKKSHQSHHNQPASILDTVMDKTLFGLVADFFNIHLPNEKKRSKHTIRAYKTSLNMLFDYTKNKNGVALRDVTFAMIDRKTLSEFLDHIENERHCDVTTRNHRLQCIRTFYNYASEIEIGVIPYWEEIKKVPVANAPENIVEYMSEKAVEAVISQPDTAMRKGRRDMFLWSR